MTVQAPQERQPKLRPMPNLAFRLMAWSMLFTDLFAGHARRKLKLIPLHEGMTIVDYGCGPGYYTIPMAQKVGPTGKVVAVDIQPLALEMVRKKARRRSLNNVQTVKVDSFETGLPDAVADLVLLVDIFHMISDKATLLKEIRRLLKLNGVLFMDSGHMNTDKAKSIVQTTGLFTLAKFDGRNMLYKPVIKARSGN